jgi:hypothetical protein
VSRFASFAALLALAACKSKPHDPAPASASATFDAAPSLDAAPPPLDAAPDASLDDLGRLDPAFLTGVTVATANMVDAADLGPIVDVRLVERLTGASEDLKPVELLLVLSGTRTIAVDVGHSWDDNLGEGIPAGSLLLIGEEEMPTPWSEDTDPDNIHTPLRSRGPILYRFSLQSPELLDSYAIVREKDALVMYTFTQDTGESSDAWEKQASIKLARGATLRFP